MAFPTAPTHTILKNPITLLTLFFIDTLELNGGMRGRATVH